MEKQVYKYFNKVQHRAMNVMAAEEVYVMARGTGKTTGIMAPRVHKMVVEMPGSRGVFVAPTYTKAWANTLPPVIAGLKSLGYIEGVHFVLRKTPPKFFRKPAIPPEHFENVISFWNGSHIQVLSQDRAGSANGSSIDWIIVDEAKLINKRRFDSEVMPAMRGNRDLFGEHPLHHSVMYLTDRPDGINGRWITAKKNRMNPRLIKLILLEQLQINKLRKKALDPSLSKKESSKLRARAKQSERKLAPLRRKAVYYSQASALENIDILGVDFIEKQRKQLTSSMFMTSILNIEIKKLEDGYYPALNPDVHCYTADLVEYSNPYITRKGSELDSDVDPNARLYISCDYGARINTVVVGQVKGFTMDIVNAMFVKAPLTARNLAKKFCRYYSKHKKKDIVYYFDSTAKHMGSIKNSYLTQWIDELEKNGWKVTKVNIGKTPYHDHRITLAGNVLDNSNMDVCNVRFNSVNCNFLLISMQMAGTKEGRSGVEKDKSSERNDNVPDEEATDFSDAFDTLIWGYNNKTLSASNHYMG